MTKINIDGKNYQLDVDKAVKDGYLVKEVTFRPLETKDFKVGDVMKVDYNDKGMIIVIVKNFGHDMVSTVIHSTSGRFSLGEGVITSRERIKNNHYLFDLKTNRWVNKIEV